MTVLEKISTAAAVAGLGVSIAALAVAVQGTNSSTRLATEALETSRQANSIALGIVREPSVIEFSGSSNEDFIFDFTTKKILSRDLAEYVKVTNFGRKPIDAIAIEVIGIAGQPSRHSPPPFEIKDLPSINTRIDLRKALQPEGFMHIDVRKMLLLYLKELRPLFPSGDSEYTTIVNVVIAPKAVTEPTPGGPGSDRTLNDRQVITIKFRPSILESPEAKKAMEAKVIPHRIYDK